MDEWVLNELLECSVCLERLDISSRVLPCQHTFCKKCLEEIVATHSELRCPECRVLVSTKIEDLPPNILLTRILEGLKNTPKSPSNTPQENTQVATTAHLMPASVQVQPVKQLTNNLQTHLPRAKALYDYTPQEPGDLSFRKGDIIILKKKIDSNWYHGELGQNQGYFPANFVQILDPLPSPSIPQCVALYDFKMSAEDEKDCLTFSKGAIVTVIRRVDENWAEGRIGDKIGIFPTSFVEMNSAAKHLMKSSLNFQPGPSRSAPALPSAATPNLITTTSSSSATTTTSSDSSPSSPPVVSNRVNPREKRFSLNVNVPQQQQQQHRRSAEFQRNRYFPLGTSELESQPLVPPVLSAPVTSPSRPAFTPPALYIALYPYKPQKPDELELRKGALYIVTEKCQDGWFKGTSVRTQKSGVFPGNYVQALRSQPHPHLAGAGPPTESHHAVVNPPKLPTRTLSPAISQLTSSSASVPPAVVARLAVTPTPRPATVPASSNIAAAPTAVNAENPKKEREKDKTGPSLMKRLTSRKKSSQALLNPYSMDNPVFEDQVNGLGQETLQLPQPNPVHMRSGSCPSQLLEIFGPERPGRDRQSDANSRHSMGGSQRVRSTRERPNILTAANSSVFSRSTPGIPGAPAIAVSTSAAMSASGAAASAAAASSSSSSPREKEAASSKKSKPASWERYRCLAPYPPNSDYELELRVGDIVYVHKKREDGWYKGTLERTGKTGLFPASFVEIF